MNFSIVLSIQTRFRILVDILCVGLGSVLPLQIFCFHIYFKLFSIKEQYIFLNQKVTRILSSVYEIITKVLRCAYKNFCISSTKISIKHYILYYYIIEISLFPVGRVISEFCELMRYELSEAEQLVQILQMKN